MELYKEGDAVLAHYGAMIYEAKVVEVLRDSDGTPLYKLHYQGWHKKHDEVVSEERVMPRNEKTLAMRKAVNQETRARENIGSSSARSKAAPKSGSKRPRKIDPVTETEEVDEGGISIPLPFALKKLLVDDWEWVTRKRCLVRIPKHSPESDASVLGREALKRSSSKSKSSSPKKSSSSAAAAADEEEEEEEEEEEPGLEEKALIEEVERIEKEEKSMPVPTSAAEEGPHFNVGEILDEFVQDRVRASGERARGATEELAEGLRLYFDRALPSLLLYRFERAQFEEYLATREPQDRRPMSAVYGAEHLLRLLTKMPEILTAAQLDSADSSLLQARLQELVAFLNNNIARFFLADYYEPPIEYVADFERALEQWATGERADWSATPDQAGAATTE